MVFHTQRKTIYQDYHKHDPTQASTQVYLETYHRDFCFLVVWVYLLDNTNKISINIMHQSAEFATAGGGAFYRRFYHRMGDFRV